MEKIEIKLNEGLEKLKFKSSIEEITKLLGEPDDIENLDFDENNNTVVLSYEKLGIALYFEESDQFMLSCIETDNESTILFGKHVFTLTADELIALMQENGFNELDRDDEVWGETRISFEDAMIDFYFENKKLTSITWGVLI